MLPKVPIALIENGLKSFFCLANVKKSYEALIGNQLRVEVSEQAVKESENAALVLKTIASLGIADITQQVQTIDLYGRAVINLAEAINDANIAKIELYRYTSTLPENLQSLPGLQLQK